MKHYSEVELLELYYVPGAATKAYLHVAGCERCRATYDRLEAKLRTAASSCDRSAEKPDSFWSRQRLSIMRDVSQRRVGKPVASRYLAAAAATIVLAISGVTWNMKSANVQNELAEIESRSAALSSRELEEEQLVTEIDPWESEQLDDYKSVIEWESWSGPADGGRS